MTLRKYDITYCTGKPDCKVCKTCERNIDLYLIVPHNRPLSMSDFISVDSKTCEAYKEL